MRMRRTLGLVALAAVLGSAPACLAQDQQQREQERQLQQQQDRQERLPDHGQSDYIRSPPAPPRAMLAQTHVEVPKAKPDASIQKAPEKTDKPSAAPSG